MSATPFISVVSPVYRAEAIVDKLVEEIVKSLSKITDNFEIILVEDRGPDNSWQKIVANCAKEPRLKGIRLSRNFGQHHAITAGLAAATGEWVVVMDCDLQDNPEYISQMLAMAQEQDLQVIYTTKTKRKHSAFKNFTAKIFFKIFNYLADNQAATDNVGAFSLLSRKTVNAFLQIKDAQRHYLMILRWLGFSHAYLPIEHQERFAGRSSYTISKLVQHAINGITSQSDKLLRVSISIGFLFCAAAFLGIILVVVQYFMQGAFQGWSSLMATLLLSTGLILMAIGIMGIYIGKIFEQVKDRPLYLTEERINF